MRVLPEFEERRRRARHDLDTATSDNIVELCRRYLALLAEYRAEFYKLPGELGVNRRAGSGPGEGDAEVRKAVRAAIEGITRERNMTEALLLSFVSVSGYEAVGILNRQKYKGHDDWELKAGGVARFSRDAAGERMTVL